MNPDMLVLDHVSKIYSKPATLMERALGRPPSAVKAVSDVSLRVPAGQTLGLVGESGCGKSTLARMVAGLFAPSAGSVTLRPLANGRSPRLQMIFQDPYSSLNGRWTIHDIVAEPIRINQLRRGEAAITQRVHELLAHCGLSASDAEKYPQEFSGGQRQRISIARALAGEPDFLVLDEPTSALDVSVQAQILNLLRGLQAELGLTSLFITHNLAVVRIMADRIGVMYLGQLVEEAPAAELFAHPRHPYTALLLQAAPDLDAHDRALHPIVGELPSPANPPSGCRFNTRCPHAQDLCRQQEPPMRNTESGMFRCHFVLEDLRYAARADAASADALLSA